jgi:hypothetical protein
MTRIPALALIATLSATPLAAQEGSPQAEEGWSLLREGAGLLFDSFRSEIEPGLQEMADALAGAEPMLRELMGMMGEVGNYHAPEIQPNGDILIRRKTPAEIAAEPPAPEVEL